MLDIGKHKGRKDDIKLLQCVNKLKQKYNSLRQACHLADISWTKFHRLTYVKPKSRGKKDYICKLSKDDIASIQEHYFSDLISFPLPDKKYQGKRFMRFNVQRSARMYNLADSTRRKISTSTYYRYKLKAVKLQGRIPYRQSCCERCQNFENIIHEASKYMTGIPSDIGDCIDRSLCAYMGYFPNLQCILRICKECGTKKFKECILQKNKGKFCDKRKRFLVKLWVTKTVRKEGAVQTFMDWKFERCNYVELVDLLMDHLGSIAEHNFMASWNYVQYREARRNITVGDVIFVHDFAQN